MRRQLQGLESEAAEKQQAAGRLFGFLGIGAGEAQAGEAAATEAESNGNGMGQVRRAQQTRLREPGAALIKACAQAAGRPCHAC
jgi:hypothetical protein